MNSNLSYEPSTFAITPVLRTVQRKLRAHFTRVWPTRRLPLCPPALAALTCSAALQAGEPTQQPGTLVVFLPEAFAAHLAYLAAQKPELLLHPDVSLSRSRAYLSWSCQDDDTQPLTVWVGLEALMGTLREQAETGSTDSAALQLLWVTGGQGQRVELFFESVSQLQRTVLEAAQPVPASAQALERARDKAQRYSDWPQLFMRYELSNAGRRYAVHLAPVAPVNDLS